MHLTVKVWMLNDPTHWEAVEVRSFPVALTESVEMLGVFWKAQNKKDGPRGVVLELIENSDGIEKPTTPTNGNT